MPPPNLPVILSPSLLSWIRAYPHLPKHSWYFVTGVALSAINRPDEIPNVYQYALEHDIDAGTEGPLATQDQLRIVRRLREGLVKSSAVTGMPKTINALFALKTVTPPELLEEKSDDSLSSRARDVYHTPPSQILQRGQEFFDRLYGKISRRIMSQMDRSGTEDLGVVARLMYSYLISNTAILSPAESSFVLIAGLIPQDVNPQLKGHLRGALNNGASVEEVRAVREVVIRICEASGMRRLSDEVPQGYGWREDVASI